MGFTFWIDGGAGRFGGNFLNEDTIVKLARDKGYSTAMIGKHGPTLLFDHTVRTGSQTIVFDDATGTAQGIPVSLEMAERLKAYKPAVRKGDTTEGQFRDSLVENVRSLVGLLPAFNLTGDDLLADITARMERDLCSLDASELRDDAKARKAVARASKLKELVTWAILLGIVLGFVTDAIVTAAGA